MTKREMAYLIVNILLDKQWDVNNKTNLETGHGIAF